MVYHGYWNLYPNFAKPQKNTEKLKEPVDSCPQHSPRETTGHPAYEAPVFFNPAISKTTKRTNKTENEVNPYYTLIIDKLKNIINDRWSLYLKINKLGTSRLRAQLNATSLVRSCSSVGDCLLHPGQAAAANKGQRTERNMAVLFRVKFLNLSGFVSNRCGWRFSLTTAEFGSTSIHQVHAWFGSRLWLGFSCFASNLKIGHRLPKTSGSNRRFPVPCLG